MLVEIVGYRGALAKEEAMASASDVAAYILDKHGPVTAMKLQKLVYYAQAWSLVWDEKPLFQDRIEAWANGPVIPSLYDCHRGQFRIMTWPKGDSAALDADERETIDSVLSFYGNRSAQWLSDLTHKEDPWRLARRNMKPGEPSNHEISLASMAEYYSSL